MSLTGQNRSPPFVPKRVSEEFTKELRTQGHDTPKEKEEGEGRNDEGGGKRKGVKWV